MKKKAVVFDLDGTLLDTLEDLMDAVNYALGTRDMPPRSYEEIRRFVGNGIRKLVERAVPAGTSEEEVQAVFDAFRPYYQAHSMDKTGPYPGVGALLDRLTAAGYRCAIVTNKARAAAVPLCAHFFPQVEVVVGEGPGLAPKPAPDMVAAALEALGVSAAEAVYVGDSEVDLATAQNAGLDHILVTWGFRDRAQLEALGGRVFVEGPEEIPSLLAEG